MKDWANAGKGDSGDVLAIERLILEFAYRFDQGDFVGAAAVIGTGSMKYLSGSDVIAEANDMEAIRRLIGSAKVYEDGTPRTHHIITNFRIDVDESAKTATSTSYVTILNMADDLSYQMTVVGSYNDRFDFGDQGWRFRERAATLKDVRGGATAPRALEG